MTVDLGFGFMASLVVIAVQALFLAFVLCML